jgi:PAS domain S-box-containing protein
MTFLNLLKNGMWLERLENPSRMKRVCGVPMANIIRFLIKKVPLRDQEDDIVRWYGTGYDIEDRKHTEDALRLVLDTTPALIHTGRPDGYLDYFNRRWLEYTGFSLADVCGWRWTHWIHPEDVEGILLKWRAALASGEPFLYEARVRRADGEYRWMLQRKIALRDEHGKIVKWYGSSIDIEERKRAEEKIRLQEMELRQVLDLPPQHVAVLGADGSRIYLNQAGLDYFGLTLDEWRPDELPPAAGWLINGFPLKMVHPDDRERVMSEVKSKLSSGLPHELEARVLGKDGKYRWFLSRVNPLRDGQGRITRWYSCSTDIEDRKQAEERLQRENVALREEIDKASMFEEIVGTSPVMQTVLSRVSKVAPADSTVLVTGETGTGKELVVCHSQALLTRIRECELRCHSPRLDRLRIVWP